MSESLWVQMDIGGPISPDIVEQLVDAIGQECFENFDEVSDKSGATTICLGGNFNYGSVYALVPFLVQHEIEFDYSVERVGELGGYTEYYRRGLGHFSRPGSCGEEVVNVDKLREILEGEFVSDQRKVEEIRFLLGPKVAPLSGIDQSVLVEIMDAA